MSDISERILVHCAVSQAARHLSAYIHAHGNRDGDVMRIRLRLPMDAVTSGGSIERSVIATIMPLGNASDPLPTYSISWAPEQPGPFPTFIGALAVTNDESYDAFRLVLAGHYEAPFGAVGNVFDAALGHGIAHACMHELLVEIRDFIQITHCNEEAAKRARSVNVGVGA
jgi:hypothetical protein